MRQYPEHLSLDGASIQLGNVELFRDWRSLTPEIDAMVDTAEVFDGIPVVHPEYLIRFKMELGRPKDMIDRELLQKYLQNRENADTLEMNFYYSPDFSCPHITNPHTLYFWIYLKLSLNGSI